MQCPSASITRKRFAMSLPPARLIERQSAVDGDRLPGDEGRIVRGEEDHGADEVARFFRALDALSAQHRLALLGGHRLPRDLGEGGARCDGVDRDPEVTELAGHRACHREDRALRGDGVQVMRAAHEDGGGGNVDDPPTALLPHLGDDRLAGQPHAADVDGHQLVPLRLADLPEGLHRDGREDRRVVDQDVETAELRTVVATISRQLVSSATSVRTKVAWPPAARHSSATAFPFASFSSATTTRAPSSTSRCAYARPIPWPAPVTIATRSSSFIVAAPGAPRAQRAASSPRPPST